ncbi:ABC transporter substrate-binding protein [Catenuloplanes sp. NPDC051500]|uniref:ABC transporter substrate-binding protein n=1 Tax=Catenuloplanes sp. NPDC051500 TaxID=3363959 RepID=UPI00378C5057
MRRLIAGLALLTLTACSGTAAGDVEDAGPPRQGGTLTVAVDTEPVSWDIHVTTQDITAEISRNVFDSLVSQDAEGRFHPWLATSWEVAPDFTSYTFHLREDVTFHDGTVFDAAAVKANFDHIVDPATKSQYAAGLLGPYTGAEVVDPHTVRIAFAEPFAPFLQAAATTYLGFYSPKALTGPLSGGGAANVGSGPFVFSAYTKGQSVTLTRNPAYTWGPGTAAHPGAAYLDSVVVRFLPAGFTRSGALTSGQVQVARAIPPQSVAAAQADPRLKVISRGVPGGNYNLWFNGSLAPLDDQRVRQAVQRGIDIDTNVRTVQFGQFPRAWSPITPTTPYYAKSLENSWPYDPALSARLLDEAGWTGRDSDGYRTKGGVRLTLGWPQIAEAATRESRDVLGQAIQADLKKIGIQVDRPSVDVGTYSAQVYGGKAHLVDLSWPRFEADVLWLFLNSRSAPATGGINATFVTDPELDAWTAAGRATLDDAARRDAYERTQRRAIDLALVTPLYTQVTIVGHSTGVHGLAFDANNWVRYADAWLVTP